MSGRTQHEPEGIDAAAWGILLERAADARITQAQIAHAVGVSEAQVSRYVNGKRVPTMPQTQRAAEMLGLRLSSLVRQAEERMRLREHYGDDEAPDLGSGA